MCKGKFKLEYNKHKIIKIMMNAVMPVRFYIFFLRIKTISPEILRKIQR